MTLTAAGLRLSPSNMEPRLVGIDPRTPRMAPGVAGAGEGDGDRARPSNSGDEGGPAAPPGCCCCGCALKLFAAASSCRSSTTSWPRARRAASRRDASVSLNTSARNASNSRWTCASSGAGCTPRRTNAVASSKRARVLPNKPEESEGDKGCAAGCVRCGIVLVLLTPRNVPLFCPPAPGCALLRENITVRDTEV